MQWRETARRAFRWASLLVVPVACSSGGGDGGGGDPPPGSGGRNHPIPSSVPLDSFAVEYTATLCTVVAGCAKPLLAGLRCSDFTLLVEEQLVSSLRDAVARGVTKYDPVKMAACLHDMETRRCDTSGGGELCDAIAGTLAADAPCTQHFECAGGFCEVTDACPGRCGVSPGLGEPCPTRGGNRCGAGLDCASDGTCAPMLREGAPCTNEVACDVGLICAEGRCTAVTELPVAAVGEPCNVLDGPFCVAGSVCGESPSTCVPIARSGGACTRAFPDPCPLGEFCDAAEGSSAGTCRPVLAEGADCTGRKRCSSGFYCLGNACSRLGSIGEACVLSATLPNGGCYSDRCVDGKCTWQDACSRALE